MNHHARKKNNKNNSDTKYRSDIPFFKVKIQKLKFIDKMNNRYFNKNKIIVPDFNLFVI